MAEKIFTQAVNDIVLEVLHNSSTNRLEIQVRRGDNILFIREYEMLFWRKRIQWNDFIKNMQRCGIETDVQLIGKLERYYSIWLEKLEEKEDASVSEEIKAKALGFLKDPNIIFKIKAKLDEKVIGEDENKILGYLVAFSSQTSDPLSLAFTGSMATGKNRLAKNILELFPPEKVIGIHRLTARALDWVGESKELSLVNKILYVYESKGTEAAIESLKLTISEGTLQLLVPYKDENGNLKSRLIKTKALFSLISTGIHLEFPSDMLNRIITTSCDETQSQTEKVLDYQNTQAELGELHNENSEVDEEIRVIQTITYCIDGTTKVVIPFSRLVSRVFSENTSPKIRRENMKILKLIEACAKLHQHQRPKIRVGDKEVIVATYDDFMIVMYALRKAINQTFGQVSDVELRLIDTLRTPEPNFGSHSMTHPGQIQFTVVEVADRIGKAQNTCYKYLENLVKAGLLFREKEFGVNKYFFPVWSDTANIVDTMRLVDNFSNLFPLEEAKRWAERFESKTGVRIDIDELYDKIIKTRIEIPDNLFRFSKTGDVLVKPNKKSPETLTDFTALPFEGE